MQMGSTVVLVSMLLVFLLRDVQLLGAAPRRRLLAKLAIYGVINGIYLTTLITILAPGREYGPFGLAHSSPLWIAGVAWHGIIWLSCAALKRRPELGWLAVLIPAPVLLLALAGAALVIQSSEVTPATIPIGAVLAVCWCAVVSGMVVFIQRNHGLAGYANCAVDFAGMTNVTALVLVPLTGLMQAF